MITAKLYWQDYRYFPYERDLAHREVETLFQAEAFEEKDKLVISFPDEKVALINRLTYFKGIEFGTSIIVPDQTKLEMSAFVNGQTWNIEQHNFPSLRRQSTRYSSHGLHEYRGKFNPQVVRAIGNLIGLEPGDWVLDPFCGSGTTLLEAAHIGWNALGFDVNPLGVMIANAKVDAFRADPKELKAETITLLKNIQNVKGGDWIDYLPNSSYLAQWFTIPVLEEITCIFKAIDKVKSPVLSSIFRVILSDICRDISLQNPADLRIRRRKEPYPEFNAVNDFSASLRTKIETISRAHESVQPHKAQQLAIFADSRFPNQASTKFLQKGERNLVDAAITSPPYATALPYVDTQRLSLCLLGLINASDIRSAERSLIGNREINEAERKLLEQQLNDNSAGLPQDIAQFCAKLLIAATHKDHGFRRRNLPALIYKYFTQMSETFIAVRKLVRHGGHYALVVGGNKTNLQGEEIIINTPLLLAQLSEFCGWSVIQMLNLETYQRYDVHNKNSIRSEVLLILKNTSNN